VERGQLAHARGLRSSEGEGFDESRVLRFAASVEVASEHPLSAAIVKGAQTRGIPLSPVDGFESLSGKGVAARVSDQQVIIGNQALLVERHVDVGDLLSRAETLRADVDRFLANIRAA